MDTNIEILQRKEEGGTSTTDEWDIDLNFRMKIIIINVRVGQNELKSITIGYPVIKLERTVTMQPTVKLS